jgi:hypothetical protein
VDVTIGIDFDRRIVLGRLVVIGMEMNDNQEGTGEDEWNDRCGFHGS